MPKPAWDMRHGFIRLAQAPGLVCTPFGHHKVRVAGARGLGFLGCRALNLLALQQLIYLATVHVQTTPPSLTKQRLNGLVSASVQEILTDLNQPAIFGGNSTRLVGDSSVSGLRMKEPRAVQTADNDQITFMLEEKDDGVWLHHRDWGLINLGPLKPVCDELFRFLETVDFCE